MPKVQKRERETYLPVLILPGFMSSGLEIKQSETKKNWEGKRIWLNLRELGFQAMTKKGTVNYRPSISPPSSPPNSPSRKQQRDDYYKPLDDGTVPNEQQQQQRQLECVNNWLQHMCLAEDMCSEVDGIKVRPIQGLVGVDYLTPGTMTNHLSYVFGPVINALKGIGYKEGVNLDAAPYDWRIPPLVLEQRDGYFTQVKEKVEYLYQKNSNVGVVLVCHSMGCKAGHYFLNWAHATYGENWVRTYIHTYMPVGAPHLGAPKSIRATIDGDKMGLDAFLSNQEGLALGRSLGSGVWLMPTQLPTCGAPSNAFLRRDGVLIITITNQIDFSPFFQTRQPRTLRMSIYYGNEVLTTDFKPPPPQSSIGYDFSERFHFAVPYSPNVSNVDYIRVVLYEPGLGISRQMSKTGPYYKWYCCPVRSVWTVAMCPIKYICCCPCLFAYRTINGIFNVASKGTDVTAGALGGSTVLGSSRRYYLSRIFKKDKTEANIDITLSHVNNNRGGMMSDFFRKRTYVKLKLHVEWQRSPAIPLDNNMSISSLSIATPSSTLPDCYPQELQAASTLKPYHPSDSNIAYDVIAGHTLVRHEGLAKIQRVIEEKYDTDPIGPRTLSSEKAPPVRTIQAIYGINLPTEVGTIYKQANVLVGPQKIQKLHDVDTSSKLKSRYYKVQNGILLETRNTPYIQLQRNSSKNNKHPVEGNNDEEIYNNAKNKLIYRSGDGTVPYWSLQHVRTWDSPDCNVTVHELEGAEHREILADARFHELLINYVKYESN